VQDHGGKVGRAFYDSAPNGDAKRHAPVKPLDSLQNCIGNLIKNKMQAQELRIGAYLQNSLGPIRQLSTCAQCTDRHRTAGALLEHLYRNSSRNS
jgi:hypothetical protein